MSLYEIGSYTLGNYDYTLYQEASSEPEDQSIRVLDHYQRKGTPSFSWTRTHLPHDVSVHFLDRDGSLFLRINDAKDQEFLIVIEENDAEIFRGWYVPEVDERSLLQRDVRLKLRFSDGVSLLKKHDWPHDIYTLTELFREIFDKLGYQLPINLTIDFEEFGVGTGNTLDNHYTDLFGFLHHNPEASYYDVLIQCLQFLNAWCWQEDGKWYVCQFGHRDTSIMYQIATDGTARTLFNDITTTISTYLSPIRWKKIKGLKRVKRSVIGIETDAELINSEFEDLNDDGTLPKHWSVDFGLIQIADSGTDEGAVLQHNSSTVSVLQPVYRMVYGRGSVSVKFRVRFEMINLSGIQSVTVGQVILYNNNPTGPGSWEKQYLNESGLSSTPSYVSVSYEIPSGNTDPTVTVDLEVEVSATIPINGLVWAEIRTISQNDNDVDTSSGWYMRYYEVSSSFQPAFGGQVNSFYEVSSEVTGNDRGEDFNLEVFLGDNREIKHKSDFYYFDGTSWNEATTWKSSNHSTGVDLNQLIADNFLRKAGASLDLIKMHVKYDEDVSLINLLTMNHFGSDAEYIPFYIERTASYRKQKLYVIEYPADQTLES